MKDSMQENAGLEGLSFHDAALKHQNRKSPSKLSIRVIKHSGIKHSANITDRILAKSYFIKSSGGSGGREKEAFCGSSALPHATSYPIQWGLPSNAKARVNVVCLELTRSLLQLINYFWIAVNHTFPLYQN